MEPRAFVQAQVEGGGPPQNAARDAAERTLSALTEQNQRLTAEKATAESQARDAAVRLVWLCMTSVVLTREQNQRLTAEKAVF